MKTIKTLIVLAAALLVGYTASAQVGYASGGAKQNGTNFVVIPQGGGLPVVTYLSATGTNTSAVVNFYYSTNNTAASAANGTTTNYVYSTNGFAAGDVLVLEHKQVNPKRVAYERLVLSSLGSSNQLIVANAAATTVSAGDVFYKQTRAGGLPVGNATLSIGSGYGVWSGVSGNLLLIDEGGSTNTTINAVNVQYQ